MLQHVITRDLHCLRPFDNYLIILTIYTSYTFITTIRIYKRWHGGSRRVPHQVACVFLSSNHLH